MKYSFTYICIKLKIQIFYWKINTLIYFKAEYWQHFHNIQSVDGQLGNTSIS